jgi:hypothetical protein
MNLYVIRNRAGEYYKSNYWFTEDVYDAAYYRNLRNAEKFLRDRKKDVTQRISEECPTWMTEKVWARHKEELAVWLDAEIVAFRLAEIKEVET